MPQRSQGPLARAVTEGATPHQGAIFIGQTTDAMHRTVAPRAVVGDEAVAPVKHTRPVESQQ